MSSSEQRRLIQTCLLDGTLEGIKVIEIYGRNIQAYVIPRLKLQEAKQIPELARGALYFLLGADELQAYIGESDDFLARVRTHDREKDFWDVAVAFISKDNSLEKGDIKYLESLAIERASQSSVPLLNVKIPPRNNIHPFKIAALDDIIMYDVWMILTFLGYNVFVLPSIADVWYCKTNKTNARAIFRGNKFVILAGSAIDKKVSEGWAKSWPKSVLEREQIFTELGEDQGETVMLTSDVTFKSPNLAGGFAAGRNVNAWTTWKNDAGQTMDEVMRRGQK
jgi:hypothetical protein